MNDTSQTPPRPVPDVAVNAGYTVRAVMPGHPAGDGLLESWLVAAERKGTWVTWECYALDGGQAGRLGYSGGDYFDGPDPAANRQRALADLAVRAGLTVPVGLRIASEAENTLPARSSNEDRRMARRLRGYLTR
jgi:hypothetical protein